MTGAIQPWHIIIVLLVFVLLFGSKKLPDAARGLGRSLRIFKSEMSEMSSDGKTAPGPAQPSAQPLPPAQPAPQEQRTEHIDPNPRSA